MSAHSFAEQLLPAVAVLGHRRIRVALAQRNHISAGLLLRRVDASGRAVEKPFNRRLARRHQHVRADQDRQHALGLMRFDETHPTHIGGKVEGVAHAPCDRTAGADLHEVGANVFNLRKDLVPLGQGLAVYCANVRMPRSDKVGHQMPPNEPTCSCDEDRPGLLHSALLLGRIPLHLDHADRDTAEDPPAAAYLSHFTPRIALPRLFYVVTRYYQYALAGPR